ncbi:protein LDOC1-like [Bombina bombina]|uniref:protein LDOC1-like n=1 Tax=Bombina bombina TaxID=8345 RepID=UPI00235A8F74|nr:protein LDOC1-like [Bombina bombina]XP_053575148.1 protein LDOC1-like [Bombina bombina]
MDPADLPQIVYNLSQRVDQLSQSLRDFPVENETLRKVIRDTVSGKILSTDNTPEPHIAPPEPFQGDRSLYRQFKNACLLTFNLKPKTYSNDRMKVLTLITYLRGEPHIWADTLYETDNPVLSSLNSFLAVMDELYNLLLKER